MGESVRLMAASPNAPASTPGMVLGMLTAASQITPWLPKGSSTKVPASAVPCHTNALTVTVFPPLSVSKVITMSPEVRLGRPTQAGPGSADWLNSQSM